MEAASPHADQTLVRYSFLCDEVPDRYEVTAFDAVEELGRPYRVELSLRAETEQPDASLLLGRDVVVLLERGQAMMRAFYGVVDEVRIVDESDLRRAAKVIVLPALASLGRGRNSRIFQGQTSLEVVTAVLAEGLGAYGRGLDTGAVDADRLVARDYCVQYQESDLEFVHRLLEEDGIGYFFVHDPDRHEKERLVLFDSNRAFSATRTMDDGPVRYDPVVRNWTDYEPLVRFVPAHRRTVTEVTIRDHDWTRADDGTIEAQRPATERATGPACPSYEHGLAHHLVIQEQADVAAAVVATATAAALALGDAALPYKVRDLPGVVLGGFTTTNESDRARVRAEQLGRNQQTFEGAGVVVSFSPGRRFELVGHPSLGVDGEYFLRRVVHSSRALDGVPADTRGLNYFNQFDGLPLATPWRPERRTAKPRIYSIQTATVTGPIGMDVFTDGHGRVKVRFGWDRTPRNPEGNYTCWLRVSQSWAGAGAPGFMFLPRVGMEVVVSFVDGDPDRPLVTGCVYNGHNATPGLLPVQATKSFIRTRTVPHGPGYNEISFEDAMGMERIHVRAERDLDELVHNDHVTEVRRAQSNLVGKDQVETIGRDQRLEVRGKRESLVVGQHTQRSLSDHFHYVNGDETITVGQSYDLDVQGGSYRVEVQGGECQLQAGGAVLIRQGEDRSFLMSPDDDEKGITITANDSVIHLGEDEIRLELGDSKIEITRAAIQINGKTFPAKPE